MIEIQSAAGVARARATGAIVTDTRHLQRRQRGACKVPGWALRERQERLGIVERPVVDIMLDAPTQVVGPAVLLAHRITPALERLGVTSVSELVATAEVDPDLYETEWAVLQDVGTYLRLRAGSATSAD